MLMHRTLENFRLNLFRCKYLNIFPVVQCSLYTCLLINANAHQVTIADSKPAIYFSLHTLPTVINFIVLIILFK